MRWNSNRQIVHIFGVMLQMLGGRHDGGHGGQEVWGQDPDEGVSDLHDQDTCLSLPLPASTRQRDCGRHQDILRFVPSVLFIFIHFSLRLLQMA